ncbi:hypothetical protein HID58_006919 [Brassica napus]|uniref:SAM-dependent MTase RsmB/NOP-type domain-containing protein n=1 Tax=Brassica napus TaxID=3708 RepID=A0ABQ8EFC4_BRANA|nr:hypothetical protein HID58_006919 [Brassica napus]
MKRSVLWQRASLRLCLAFCFCGPTTSDATTGEKEPVLIHAFVFFVSLRSADGAIQFLCSSVVDAMLLRYWEARNVKGGGELMWVDMLMVDIKLSVVKPQPGDMILNACAAPGGKTLFHGILLETPRADLRLNCKLEDMEELKNLQDELLDSASNTCSIDPEENQGRVEAFLLRHPEFSVDPVDRLVPSSFVTSQGVFLSNPVKHSLDGAFAARLVRAL